MLIPQDKLLELAKYLVVIPKEVEFTIEDIQGVNDFKVGATSQTLIYIKDIKVDVLDTTGDLTHPTQFLPLANVDQLDMWLDLHQINKNGEYGALLSCELVQNSYVQKIGTNWEELEIGVSRRDVRWKTINIKPQLPNISQSWKNQISFMMQLYHFYKDIGTILNVPIILILCCNNKLTLKTLALVINLWRLANTTLVISNKVSFVGT